jgi:hypothetical protein
MTESEYAPRYRVVAVRRDGERIEISTHTSRQSAELAVNLVRLLPGGSNARIQDVQ